VTDDFAETISLGPATDGEPGDDWALSFTPEGRIGIEDQLSYEHGHNFGGVN
jgi:hypothetical protein